MGQNENFTSGDVAVKKERKISEDFNNERQREIDELFKTLEKSSEELFNTLDKMAEDKNNEPQAPR